MIYISSQNLQPIDDVEAEELEYSPIMKAETPDRGATIQLFDDSTGKLCDNFRYTLDLFSRQNNALLIIHSLISQFLIK